MTTGCPVRPEVTLAGPGPENPEDLFRAHSWASRPLLGPGNLHVDQRGPSAPGTPGPEKHRSPTWRQFVWGPHPLARGPGVQGTCPAGHLRSVKPSLPSGPGSFLGDRIRVQGVLSPEKPGAPRRAAWGLRLRRDERVGGGPHPSAVSGDPGGRPRPGLLRWALCGPGTEETGLFTVPGGAS